MAKEIDVLTLEDGAYRLSRNVCNKLPVFAAEARNNDFSNRIP